MLAFVAAAAGRSGSSSIIRARFPAAAAAAAKRTPTIVNNIPGVVRCGARRNMGGGG